MMKKLLLLTFIFITWFSAGAQTLLTTAVHFEAKDFEGVPHNLTEYLDDDKYVMLSFYTVNCGTCMTYSPHVSQTYENFGCNNGDVIVLGVNWGATNYQLSQHHQQYDLIFPALSGLEGYGNDITSDYQIESFISVILIAPVGDIVNQYIFPPSTAVLDSTLLSYGLSMMDCTVGAELTKAQECKLEIFPNPASTSFRFRHFSDAGPFSIGLYDLNGRVIRDYGEHSALLPAYSVDGLEPGLYVVKVHSETDISALRLFIIR